MNAPALELADTHCHLDLSAFDTDLIEVLDRATENGVKRILIPGIDLDSSREAIQLAERYSGVYAAVGVHPHRAKSWDPTVAQQMRTLTESPCVCAIGEIGLDFYRNLAPQDIQRRTFKAQLALAADVGLPVVVHSRQAIREVLDYLLPWAEKLPEDLKTRAGVLHAYSGDLETASEAFAGGFYVGIGGPLTYRKAQNLRDVTAQMPTDRLLLETDAPYLTPHPYRHRRNEPANVRLVAQELATLFGMEESTIAQITSQNAATLFGWNNGNKNSHIL
ncbi:MAG: TatD family hydrolase [Anaerolineales bacterium]|jgi:TatD DNase family protein